MVQEADLPVSPAQVRGITEMFFSEHFIFIKWEASQKLWR